MKRPMPIVLILLVALLTGCGFSKARQLELVARDWCMTVRASQVIPVYPLTEDLQPGDIFLVETPAAQQARDYQSKGYLPLDHLLGRMNPPGYAEFYQRSFGIADNSDTPHHWQFPDAEEWTKAPWAGFPSYNIAVRRGGGINAAFPISGVPVGLTLLGASSASATVTLKEAHTYGLDAAALEAPFQEWVATHRNLVSDYAGYAATQPHYLRLVSRVYVVRTVNVSLTDDRSAAASASGGIPKPVDILDPAKSDAAANYSAAISTLERLVAGLSEAAPGGTLKLAAASTRAVSLDETFERPVVIGYVARDYPIRADGTLGTPVSTRRLLEGMIPQTTRDILDEQARAGILADAIASRLQRMNDPAQVQAAVDAALANNLIDPPTAASLKSEAAAQPDAVVDKLIKTARMTAKAGHVTARCDLDQFLVSLDRL